MTEPTTLVTLLEAAQGSARGLRILDRAEREMWYSWSDVGRRALEVAGGLHRSGVRPGDRIALIHPTSIEFVECLFGAVLAGAVPVPLYPPVRLHRLDGYHARTARMLGAVAARMIVVDPALRPVLGTAVAEARPELGCRTRADLAGSPGSPFRRGADEIALIQFSSGTTVDPKPVALSHRAVVAQVRALNGHWPDDDHLTHSGVSWLPLYHDMGLIGCLLSALERPGTLTLIPPELFLARPGSWLRAISRNRATISVAPSFGYALAADRVSDDELADLDLRSWRVALCGAEPVVPEVLRRFIDRFEPVGLRREALSPVYGLSEASLAVTFSDLHRPFVSRRFDRDGLSLERRAVRSDGGVELVSVGRPLPDTEIRIVDGDGRPCPPGEIGGIEVRGPSLMTGYFGRPEETAEVIREGWLDTGDLGFVDDDELYVTGREKDLLILRGRSHDPSEVEAVVDTVAGVRTGCAAAVSWLPEGADGEVLLVLVETAKDADAKAVASIAADGRTAVRVATGLEVDAIEVLSPGTLPRTSSGKIRRGESLRRYLAGELEAPSAATPLRLIGAAILGSVRLARLNWGRGV